MRTMSDRIYLDYAATTPLAAEARAAMEPWLAGADGFGNASSLYAEGRAARAAVRGGRERVAALLGAAPDEVIFTSGGSESDNWVLQRMCLPALLRGEPVSIVTTPIEHHAVLHTCDWLAPYGATVRYLPVDPEGRVQLADVQRLVDSSTRVVSIMLANNEIGTIEPVAAIGAWLHEHQPDVMFHCDAVQAAGHIPVAVDELHVDALSVSAHKLYGPQGIGALYLRRGWGNRLGTFIHGGAQEHGLRAGTENVAGIVGFGAAAELAQSELAAEAERLVQLRDQIIAGLTASDRVWLNGAYTKGSYGDRLPGNVSFGIKGLAQDSLLIRLDMAGFSVSAGSACSAGAAEPSHVLRAVGLTAEQARSCLRVTLGRYTSADDVERFLQLMRPIIAGSR